MRAFRLISSRLLPKTNLQTEYVAGDDGTKQAGWWKNERAANNRLRFISLTIGGQHVVIDKATGLMWAAYITEAGCYANSAVPFWNAVTQYEYLDWCGFSDWRLPNFNELISIADFNQFNFSIYTSYFTVSSGKYWTSTTNPKYTDEAHAINFYSLAMYTETKTVSLFSRCCRNL